MSKMSSDNGVKGIGWVISLVMILLLNTAHEAAAERLTRPKRSIAVLVFSSCDDLSNKSSLRTKMFSS